MGEKKTINVLVTGGEANAGPPLGPALGPLGVNVMNIVQKINELTKDYSGMRAPVKVTVDSETKEFDVEVGIPTTSALIIKESGVPKGSGTPHESYVGNLSFNTTDDELKEAFSEFGEVISANVITDRVSGRSRGFGFVEYAEEAEAQSAKEAMNGKDFMGRALRVDEAKDQRQDRGSGGGQRRF